MIPPTWKRSFFQEDWGHPTVFFQEHLNTKFYWEFRHPTDRETPSQSNLHHGGHDLAIARHLSSFVCPHSRRWGPQESHQAQAREWAKHDPDRRESAGGVQPHLQHQVAHGFSVLGGSGVNKWGERPDPHARVQWKLPGTYSGRGKPNCVHTPYQHPPPGLRLCCSSRCEGAPEQAGGAGVVGVFSKGAVHHGYRLLPPTCRRPSGHQALLQRSG